MWGRLATFTKKFDYQRPSGSSQGYKNRRLPGKKRQQKGNFLQQKHSLVKKKTQQGRNLCQGNCSSTTFRWKFTRNSSIIALKGYTSIRAKLISKCKSQQFPSSRKAAIFLKRCKKMTSNPKISEWVSGLKIDFILEPFQEKVPHHPKMSGQESLLVTKEVESLLKKGAIQKTSVKTVNS